MTTTEFTENIESIFAQICGEQAVSWVDDDGDTHFEAFHGGKLVGAFVESFGDRENLLIGFHVVGEAIEDMHLAAQFVNEHNHRITVGRYMIGPNNGVVFTYQLPEAAINCDSVRFLLNIVAGASLVYPELAKKTGALHPEHIAALDALTEDGTDV